MPKQRWLALSTLFAGLSGSLYAVDGVVLIDQNRALAGGVTPGDTPGFPVTISQSGSYRLAGNLTVPDANTHGILVMADNVLIDLNGFSILGPTVCPFGGVTTAGGSETTVTACSPTGTGVGIKAGDLLTASSAGPVANGRVGVRVTNGTVTGMGSHGVILGPSGRVDIVTAKSNGGHGVVSGRGSIVQNNIGIANGMFGFYIGNASVVQGNTATLNMGNGYEMGSGLLFNSVAGGNGAFGIVQFGDSLPHVFSNNSSQP
jgi:hypothetical protein